MNRAIRNAGIFIVAVSATMLGFTIGDVQLSRLDRIHDPASLASVPHAPVAIVLGAGIKRDGSPSDALRDRLLVGIQLYEAHTVDKLILSGDDGDFHVDEISAMKSFVHDHNVPDADIITDGKGYRTYESCKRAKEVFHVDRAIVVTQRFHIGRAVYLCNMLGIDTDGVTSDLQTYVQNAWFWIRDLLSSAKAWFDINILPPKPPAE